MKTKLEKQKIIQEIFELFNKSSKLIFVSLLNIPAESQKILKDKIKEANGLLKVFKKTLIKKSIKNLPLDLESEEFKKPFGIIFDFNKEQEIGLLKNLVQISENIKLEIIKGILNNKVLEKNEILEIGKLPPLEILRAKLISIFRSKPHQFMFLLKSPINKIIMVASNLRK